MTPENSLPSGGVTGNDGAQSYSHLKAKKTGVSLHQAVALMADRKWREQGYKSRSAYLSGLVVFDYYCGQKHRLTAELMNQDLETQEAVFAEVLAHPGKETSWFKHRIEEIISERSIEGTAQKAKRLGEL
jgi:hypothetical protein